MATEIDWTSMATTDNAAGSGSEGGNQKKFLKFESGKTHVFRPLGGGVEFYKFFVNTEKGKRTIIVDLPDKDKAAELLSKHFGREITPQHRYAINVLDREDGQVKILEGGHSIFKFFAKWSKLNQQLPGSQAGGDWAIDVQGDGLQRRYTTGFMRPAPLSQEETKRIKEKKEMYSLKEVYKSTAVNEIVGKITGEPASAEASVGPTEDGTSIADDPSTW